MHAIKGISTISNAATVIGCEDMVTYVVVVAFSSSIANKSSSF